MNDIITRELLLDQDIDRVWHAISDQEEISSWFLQANFKAEVGFKYTFTSSDSSCEPIIGEVLEASPYKLVYTWIEKGVDVVTTVRWTLSKTDTGTKLTLVHDGIANYSGETAVTMFNTFSGGWDNCMKSLGKHLLQGSHV